MSFIISLINFAHKGNSIMEEKKMNEEESLALISEMIQSTKAYIEIGRGNSFLYWGYFTVALGIAIQLIYLFTEWDNSGLLWLLMFAFWIFMSVIHRGKRPTVKTYITKVIEQVWYIIGVMFIVTTVVFLALCFTTGNFSITNLLMPLSAIYVGIGTSITGVIVRKPLVAMCPFVGIGIGLYMLAAIYTDTLPLSPWPLIFSLSFVFMMVIPGHILNREKASC